MATDGTKTLSRADSRQVGKSIATGRVRTVRKVQSNGVPQALCAEPPNRPPVIGRVHVGDEPGEPWSKELIKAIAMDIGKDTVAYIEVMYPKAIEATSSTFKLSVRNHIYNQIMAAIEVTDEGKVNARLRDRKKFRRDWTAAYRKIRRKPTPNH